MKSIIFWILAIAVLPLVIFSPWIGLHLLGRFLFG